MAEGRFRWRTATISPEPLELASEAIAELQAAVADLRQVVRLVE